MKNQDKILNKAKRTYTKVTKKLDITLIHNSCDFILLEKAMNGYISIQEIAAEKDIESK